MKPYSLPVASLLLVTASAWAETTTFAPVVVTASRTAETVDETLSFVTVIDRSEIEQGTAQSLQDLLDGVKGITITNSGGLGKSTSVFLRGTDSGQLLVLVDGMKIGSATLGSTPFQHIPLDQIERIEIVRGPRSSLYGSEAIGGVIQVFTRKGSEALKPRFSIGAGTEESYKITAGLSGGSDKSWFNLGISGLDTRGINACSNPAECFVDEPDLDGYDRYSISARGGYQFTGDTSADLSFTKTRGSTEFDGPSQNSNDFTQQLIALNLSSRLTSNWTAKVLAGRNLDESDNYLNGVFANSYNTQRDNINWQNDIQVGDSGLLTLGLDFQNDKITSSADYVQTERQNHGYFAQYQASRDRHDYELSIRQDDNEQFGRHTTGSVGWGYQLQDELRLTASYGTAFRAPTFNDLYFPADPWSRSNPDLVPEESQSVEFGIAGEYGNNSWSATIYQTEIENLIAWEEISPWFYEPNNVAKARIRGIELEHKTTLGSWNLNSQLTLQDPENRGDDENKGNVLQRRAQKNLRLDLNRDFGRYTTAITLNAVGHRYNEEENTTKLGGYATVDLGINYELSDSWQIKSQLNNLFDKNYQTVDGYNQLGRTFFATLSYTP